MNVQKNDCQITSPLQWKLNKGRCLNEHPTDKGGPTCMVWGQSACQTCKKPKNMHKNPGSASKIHMKIMGLPPKHNYFGSAIAKQYPNNSNPRKVKFTSILLSYLSPLISYPFSLTFLIIFHWSSFDHYFYCVQFLCILCKQIGP